MKKSIFYFLYISIILILVLIILLFVTNFTLTRFVPDNLINLRIHQPNSEFIQELSQSVIKSSNDSIEIKQYIIKTGEHGEIIEQSVEKFLNTSCLLVHQLLNRN